ncbi:translation initiation factor IF-2 [Mitsuokella multacida]|uniref:Translation initiation factor IF-2 n=1 Tax=Mitsuokella multacida TaxID=52226 RepID=A0A414NZJ5_9FIRM|nr:translation initiation factor IF-2 [Mitsuokella multacida]RHF53360.1 translation initiation factor IF-2 [Mitsuokella multacida]
MSKYRVYELAKEFNTDSKVILDILKRNKFKAANNFSSVGEEERTAIKNSLSNKGAKPQAKAPAAPAAQKPAAKPAEKRAEKPQAGKQNHGNNGSNGNNGRNERNERRSDAGRNNGNGNHNGGNNGGNRAASGSNRPSHNNGGNNGGNRNSNGGGNNNRGGNRNDRRNGSRNERGGRNDRNDRNNRFGSKNDRNRRGRNNKRGGQQAPKVEIAHPKHIKLPETIAVKDLASKMSYTAAEVVKKLFMMGVMATINQEIDFDTAALVASEFGVTCEELPPEVDPTEIPEIEDDPKTLKLRPPVVTVMGHVDHGKTSLLDCIRNTHVQTHEAGGITQHIGAYQVNCKGKKIVFLDTPGHEAFTAMRARGAQITDIAILVVAADDGVMPQTIEAIHHAKSAGVPIIVAINKIDKPGANPDRVKQELMEQGLVPEEYGGDTIMVPVSAKKQIGIDDLLEMVLLVAEVKELKANPNRDARGVIVEAKLDKGRGPVATVLVQNGTLRIGDSVVCGTTYGKVRAMVNDRGENVKKAGPSVPVEILGLNDVPEAGDILAVLEEKQARSIAEARIERQRNNLIKSKKVSLDDLFHQIQEGDIKDLNIVIKADVQGSVEALSSSLLKLNKNDEVRVSIVHSGVGAVNESDVMLASASNALIIAFNVRPDANARKLADTENIDIRTYRVIYDAINDVKDAMSGMLKPKYKEVIQGRVEIRQVMKFSKALVAGSYVLEGKICNNSKIRIIRDNIEIFDGEIDSLRRFKDEVKEVNAGYECGISIVDFRDFKEGDIIEAYTMEEIATTIADANKAAAKKREEEAKAAAAKAKENAKD